MFDFDDLGAQENELKTAERPCQDVGNVQHADTIEWKRHLSYPVAQRMRSLCWYGWSHAAGACTAHTQEMSVIGPGRKAARKFGRIQQILQIDARVVAQAFQKVDEIFRGEIPARARAVRATAQA